MDLNELKKLINEVKQEKKKDLLKEQEEESVYYMTENSVRILKSLLQQLNQLPQIESGDSFTRQAMNDFQQKLFMIQKNKEKWDTLKGLEQLYSEMSSEIPQISLADILEIIKKEPKVFNSIKTIFLTLGLPKVFIDNFENDLKQELENYQSMNSPVQSVNPQAKTIRPGSINQQENPMTKALNRARGNLLPKKP